MWVRWRCASATAAADLVLRPQLQSLEVNPESPNLPTSVAMRVEEGKHRAQLMQDLHKPHLGKLTAIPAAVLAWQTGPKTDDSAP
jgi:hypothetical protein